MKVSKTEKLNQVSRRDLLKTMGLAAGGAALGAGTVIRAAEGLLTPESVSGPSQATTTAATFWKGADVSWLPQMEASGYQFLNTSGKEEDCLAILKAFGITAVRLRTWVNPSSSPQNGHCSQPETIAMAVRCKKAGLASVISFQFGDTWNDVGHQYPPAAWKSMTYSRMLTAMRNYVHNFCAQLQSNGVTPIFVNIGNEINSGICHPIGTVSNGAQMTGLLNGAYDMVKAVYPATPVCIHLAQPQNSASITNFFDTYRANGGKWDVSAFSSYGSGSEIPGILANIQSYRDTYGKPVMQTEFGGPYNNPSKVKADLETYIKGIRGMGGLGVFYWEPECYNWNGYLLGAWNPNTMEPTAALQGFEI